MTDSTNNDILVKVGYQKDDADTVSKESINENISKYVYFRFQLFTLQLLLVAVYRCVFRTQSNVYDGDFLQKNYFSF